MSEITFEEWWAYVVKHEIEPTLRSYCRMPIVTTPISWPASPLRPVKPVFHGLDAPNATHPPIEGGEA